LYVILCGEREALRSGLKERGIGSDIHYPVADHQQESAAGLPLRLGVLETTERCCREVLTLPCFPEMTDAEVEAVIAAAVECAGRAHD
jgi:dTDP-4-amino-4,6-dideoxygalactose transaminase